MIVEKIALNPTFDNAQFTRPSVPNDTRAAPWSNQQSVTGQLAPTAAEFLERSALFRFAWCNAGRTCGTTRRGQFPPARARYYVTFLPAPRAWYRQTGTCLHHGRVSGCGAEEHVAQPLHQRGGAEFHVVLSAPAHHLGAAMIRLAFSGRSRVRGRGQAGMTIADWSDALASHPVVPITLAGSWRRASE